MSSLNCCDVIEEVHPHPVPDINVAKLTGIYGHWKSPTIMGSRKSKSTLIRKSQSNRSCQSLQTLPKILLFSYEVNLFKSAPALKNPTKLQTYRIRAAPKEDASVSQFVSCQFFFPYFRKKTENLV